VFANVNNRNIIIAGVNMNSKTVTMSVRMTREDAEFISSLDMNDAATPSDKIRGIISQYKELVHGTKDYGKGIKLMKNLVQEPNEILLAGGRKLNLHSELPGKFADWATEALAYYITSVPAEADEISEEVLLKLEEGIARRIFSLMENILRMGITEKSPTFNQKIIRDNIEHVLELVKVIQLYRETKKENIK